MGGPQPSRWSCPERAATHGILADADIEFAPATSSDPEAESLTVAQGTIDPTYEMDTPNGPACGSCAFAQEILDLDAPSN